MLELQKRIEEMESQEEMMSTSKLVPQIPQQSSLVHQQAALIQQPANPNLTMEIPVSKLLKEISDVDQKAMPPIDHPEFSENPMQ